MRGSYLSMRYVDGGVGYLPDPTCEIPRGCRPMGDQEGLGFIYPSKFILRLRNDDTWMTDEVEIQDDVRRVNKWERLSKKRREAIKQKLMSIQGPIQYTRINGVNALTTPSILKVV